jgi:uncharacterized protein (TIGR02246 family)
MDTKILDQWAEAVNQGDPDEILGYYAEDSVLIPTFSKEVINSKDGIRGYFEMLVKKKGMEVKILPATIEVQKLGDNIQIFSGIYRWKFVEKEEISYDARFSFVVKDGGKSPILHHHSSQAPGMI